MSHSIKVVTVITKYKDSVSLVNIATAFSILGKISSSEKHTIRNDLKKSLGFTNLISVLEERIDKFETREFINILVGLVKIGYYNENLFNKLVEKCLELSITDPQHLAMTAWAFAKVDHYSKELFRALKNESIKKIRGFNPQNIANTAWAFAKVDHYSETLFDALENESIKNIRGFNPQNIAMTAWAFAKVDHYSKELFRALKNESIKKIRDFNPPNMTTIALAFAKVDHYSKTLFDALRDESIKNIREFNPQNIANAAWAFAKVDHYSETLFDALKNGSIKKISEFNPQNIANTAWAFAKMNHYSETLFDALRDEFIKNIREFNLHELVNTAWAFAVFNKKDIVKNIIDYIIENYHMSKLRLKTKVQLIQAASLFKNEYSGLIGQIRGDHAIETNSSTLQKEIYPLLVQIGKGISFSEEEEVIANCIVDIAINANKIAIEIDGPSHYADNFSSNHHLLGKNRLKKNILLANDWSLIRIPYFDWDNKTTEGARKEYLIKLLKDKGLIFPEKRKR